MAVKTRNRRRTMPFQRVTRPTSVVGKFHAGSTVVVPRRAMDTIGQRILDAVANGDIARVQSFYKHYPLIALRARAQGHCFATMAHANNAGLMFSPGDVEVEAVKIEYDEDGTNKTEEVDNDATQKVREFWDKYSGSIVGFCRGLLLQMELTGMICAEAVPARRGEGLDSVVTFDPLTVFFEDDTTTGKRIAYQRTDGLIPESPTDVATYNESISEVDKIPLDPIFCFVGALDGDSDNPYGRPMFAGALAELFKDDFSENNITEIMHAWAFPHTVFGYPFDERLKFAVENPEVITGQGDDGEDLTPYEWVWSEFEVWLNHLKSLAADDPIIGPKGMEGKVLETGQGLSALDTVMRQRRHRIAIGLDQLPNLMGMTDGGTQAYAKEQTKLHVKKLESYRFLITEIIRKISDLHLRLLGINIKCRIITKAIMPEDRLREAQAQSVEVETSHKMTLFGWISNDEASIRHTGSSAIGPDISMILEHPDAFTDPDDTEDDPDGEDNPNDGNSDDEEDDNAQ